MAKKKSKKDKASTAFQDAPELVYGGQHYGSLVFVPDPKSFVKTDDDIERYPGHNADLVVYQKVGTARVSTNLAITLLPSFPTKDENQSKEATNK